MDPDYYDVMAALQRDHWWYRARRTILQRAIAGLSLPAQPRILEAGCGPGGNLAMLAGFGPTTAFEPHAPARLKAAAMAQAQVLDGGLPDRIPVEGPFDLVCAFDVIEHVDDDVGAVRALAQRLAPGGRLMLTVPAYQWLWSYHDERNHHRRRYTRAQLTAMMRAAGLEVRHASYFNCHLFPLVASVRAANALLGLTQRRDEAMPPAWLNRALTAVFAAEAPVVTRWGYPFGVSILAIGQ